MFVAITVFFFVSMIVMGCITDDNVSMYDDNWHRVIMIYGLCFLIWIFVGSIVIYWGFN